MAQGKRTTASERKERIKIDSAFRRQLFAGLCQHLRDGYSIDCYGPISFGDIQLYTKTYPNEFVVEELDDAIRDAKQGWEDIGRRQSDGKCMGNSRAWQYNMINRYNWTDRVDVKAQHSGAVEVSIVNYAGSTTPTPSYKHD